MRKVRWDDKLPVETTVAHKDGVISVYVRGGGGFDFGLYAQSLFPHVKAPKTWMGQTVTAADMLNIGATLNEMEIGEPDPAPDVPAAPQLRTAAMHAPSGIQTATDLLERAIRLGSMVSERESLLHTAATRAKNEGTVGPLQSLAGELFGDINRMQNLVNAAATILVELRSRG